LVVGQRVPRWPECHYPDWALGLEKKRLQESVLKYITEVINHYKFFSSIAAWQVENEPLFFLFGNCPKPDKEFLKEEIKRVKSLDPERPIIITDSGELSFWRGTAGSSEIFGTTLYRLIWNKFIGWHKHFYPPVFYTFRSYLVKKFTPTEKVIIAEMQAEPWGTGNKPLTKIPFEEQVKKFDLKEFEKVFRFARKTGVKEIYVWGVEWWYWRKTKGDSSFWDTGKEFMLNNK